MKRKILFGVVSLCVLNQTQAGVMPNEEKSVQRLFPDENSLKNDTEYKKKFEEMKDQLEDLRKKSENAQNTLKSASDSKNESNPQSPPETIQSGQNKESNSPALDDVMKGLPTAPLPGALPRSFKPNAQTDFNASEVQVFNVSQAAIDSADSTMTVLPAGSFVRARVVSGVEAVENEPYPVLLQLEYAFTGPNKSKIDLSNCFMIAKAKANLSTERVIMDTETLSCVRQNGEHFKTAVRGYTAGEDSSFGSTGTYISKQGQVLLAAVLANIAKNAGEAVALAQQTTQVVSGGTGSAASATNVTGSQAAFVGGKSLIDASSLIANWYLEQARKLVPSIGIGSGKTVHVIILDTVRVPTLNEEE